MKTNKNLFNQIFEQFQMLNEEVDEQNALGSVNLHQSSNQPTNNNDDNIEVDDIPQPEQDNNESSIKVDEIAKIQLQLLNDKFKDEKNKKTIIDKIIKKALGKGDGDETEAKELIERIKQALGE